MFAKRRVPRVLASLGLAVAGLCVTPEASARSGIFGGGPFYHGGQPMMDSLRASGFDTVLIWAIHVNGQDGTLTLNDDVVVRNGQYVGRPEWPDQLRTLKQGPTSVNRIEIIIGSAGPDDWRELRRLIDRDGTGPNSTLRRNFQVLANLPGIDAFGSDDEADFDVDAHVQFGRMAASMGKKFTLVPFHNQGFWAEVKRQLGPGIVDRVYVQHYAGGGGNHPAGWNDSMGIKIDPGLWSRHGEGHCGDGDSPDQMRSRFQQWKDATGIVGGWVWLADDILRCSGNGGFSQYAGAINSVFGGGGGGGGRVQLFQHCNFGGWVASFDGTGTVSTAQLQNAGGVNNDASSIRIAGGLKVTLYDGNNQTGASIVLTGDTACLVDRSFNDLASSMRIENAGGGDGGVVFFQDVGFGGAAGPALPRGSYTLPQLQARGISNDWASSARIPPGFTVTLYEHDNLTGRSWTLAADTPSFVTLIPNANDVMSSCRIE